MSHVNFYCILKKFIAETRNLIELFVQFKKLQLLMSMLQVKIVRATRDIFARQVERTIVSCHTAFLKTLRQKLFPMGKVTCA